MNRGNRISETRAFIVRAVACALIAIGCEGRTESPAPDGAARGTTAPRPEPEKVLLFAAASTSTVLDEIKQAFGASHPETIVRTNYGASSTLAQQIAQGAEADLFLSASEQWADFLGEKELVAERRDLLGNVLVVVVPKDASFKPKRLEDLADPALEHLALADTEAVPAGVYAKQALTKLGLWEQLRSKVASGDDVRQTLTFIETGAAEAGIVYKTDAAVSRKVDVAFEIDPTLTDPIRYPLVLLKHGAERKGARQFAEYLRSPEATASFRKHGFIVLADRSNGE